MTQPINNNNANIRPAGIPAQPAPGANVPGGGKQPSATAPTAAPKMVAAAQPFFVARDIDEMIDYQNILFYGEFGCGKTTLASSALYVPEMWDILFISIEGGEKALKEVARQARKMGIDPKAHILVIPIQTYAQFGNIYEALKLHIKFRDANDITKLRRLEAQLRCLPADVRADDSILAEVLPNPMKFQTVIIDSLTEAQKYCMYQLLGIDPETQKLDAKPSSAEWADWGGSREMIQFLVRRFRDMPVNAIFTCSDMIDQDKMKVFHHMPSLPGKLANDIRGIVDTVGYLMDVTNADGTVSRRCILRTLTFNGSQHVVAKHRYGSNLKGNWVDNPTMKVFYDLNQ